MIAFEPLLDELSARTRWSWSATSTRRWRAPWSRPRPDCCVAHVEAGLRSRDWSDARGDQPRRHRPAQRLPASPRRPTPSRTCARRATRRPDPPRRQRHDRHAARQRSTGPVRRRDVLRPVGVARAATALVTLHRPANVDDPTIVSRELRRALARDRRTGFPLVFPVHPAHREPARPSSDVPAGSVCVPRRSAISTSSRCRLGARLVLTDSGRRAGGDHRARACRA